MIVKVLFTLLFICFSGIAVSMIMDITKKKRTILSFKEALDLTSLPVVTFFCKGKKLNFVLDSGATHSVINTSVVEDLALEVEKFTDFEGIGINTASGSIMLDTYVKMPLQYDDRRIFDETLLVIDMTEQFNNTKQSTGVTLHGLLGSDFFSKNKFIIDYDLLAAYTK